MGREPIHSWNHWSSVTLNQFKSSLPAQSNCLLTVNFYKPRTLVPIFISFFLASQQQTFRQDRLRRNGTVIGFKCIIDALFLKVKSHKSFLFFVCSFISSVSDFFFRDRCVKTTVSSRFLGFCSGFFFLSFFMYNLHEQKTFSLVVNSFGFSPDDDDVWDSEPTKQKQFLSLLLLLFLLLGEKKHLFSRSFFLFPRKLNIDWKHFLVFLFKKYSQREKFLSNKHFLLLFSSFYPFHRQLFSLFFPTRH